jgi:asparagine synthase (glutamine-hydrolysing)
MSGLVALLHRDEDQLDQDALRTMLDSIDHRGPDGRGSWCDDYVGLGHQQLRSTPEARFDEQPHRDDELVIVADARIDNRAEVIDTLDLPDTGQPIPDSHLILAAYRAWGERCVDNLLGAFAFVVWDTNRNVVFCARDHFGVKPIYYCSNDHLFAVASEIAAILAHPSVPPSIDEVKIGDFLIGRFGDKSNTHYEHVRRLPPAHAMSIRSDETNLWQYWDLDPTRTIRLPSDAAYERRFRELFERAVRCRLRTADPVGVTLSGGMDSSSITVMARSLLSSDDPLHTFYWVFEEAPSSDEREYIESVTDREGIVSHYLQLDDVGVLVDREDVFARLDEPPFNSMHYAWWETSKLASEVGTGVLLDGAMGDSAISYGLGLLPDLLRTGRWKTLYDELHQLGDRWDVSPCRLFVSRAVKPLVPDRIQRYVDNYRGEPVLEAAMNPTLSAEFVDRIDLRSRCRALYADDSIFPINARQQQYQSILMGLTTANLERFDERCARFGIEPRHPFADKRLVEFSLAMPADQQLSDGWTRSIIRRSLDDLLPQKVRTRPWKTPVSEGFWNALSIEDERLQTMVENPGPLVRYLDADALRPAYDRFNRDQAPDPYDARALWWALSLSVWLETLEMTPRPEWSE